MIPMILITGFLGSGKTTLLKRLARQGANRRLAFLVNDFSAIDVDGEQLRQVTDNVLAIPGGSIFCRCLAGDFITHLEEIPARFGSPETPLEGVIVEASGIADPRVTAKLLHETGMDKTYELRRILAVIDPGSFHKLLATLPAIRTQVEAADTIVINKTDVFPDADIDRTEARVREINAVADLHRTSFCQVDFDPLAKAPRTAGADGDMAPCRDPQYATFEVNGDDVVSFEALEAALQAVGNDLYRVKGDIRTDRGVLHVEGGVDSLEWTQIQGTEPADARGLAVIVRGQAEDRVRDILEAS
ncbi:MAG: CobW family GTP-binding protein, partial [Verrucomicrobiota bacterium]